MVVQLCLCLIYIYMYIHVFVESCLIVNLVNLLCSIHLKFVRGFSGVSYIGESKCEDFVTLVLLYFYSNSIDICFQGSS